MIFSVVGSYGTAVPPLRPPPEAQSSSVPYWATLANESHSGPAYNYSQGKYSQSADQGYSTQPPQNYSQGQQGLATQSPVGQPYSGGSAHPPQSSQAAGYYNQSQAADSYGLQQSGGQYIQMALYSQSKDRASHGPPSNLSDSKPASVI